MAVAIKYYVRWYYRETECYKGMKHGIRQESFIGVLFDIILQILS